MKKEEIRERIEQLEYSRLIEVWNEYQFDISGEDVIYRIEEFDEICFGMTPLEIAENISGGKFDVVDDYFMVTPYGFESFPFWDVEEHISITDLVNWLAEDVTYLGMI